MPNSSSALALSILFCLACEEVDLSRYGGLGPLAGATGMAPSAGPQPPGDGSAAVGGSSASPGEGPRPGMDGNGAGGSGGAAGAAGAPASGSLEWLPSWATSIQRTEPNNLPPPLGNATLRQFVWPTVSGQQIRIQLSNEKGSSAVEIRTVHVARALTQGNPGNSGGQIDVTSDAAFLFAGAEAVTIPAGQTVWSDPLDFPLQELQLTAVTMAFGGAIPAEITGHPGARETSYIVSGDVVAQQGLPGAQTRDRWYFINAIEVMAPSDAFAIAALGDSITDGYGVLNQFARWPDFMTLALQDDVAVADNRSVLNFGMGANALTSSSTYQDAGVLRFERDVLTRDKIKWLIVLEGINDIRANVQAQPIIQAYQQIIERSREKGILVYGATITPNGPSAVRTAVNDWIRGSGEFDAVIDFDAALRDPGDVNRLLPMYDNDGLHPSIAGYEAMGNAVAPSLFYAPAAD